MAPFYIVNVLAVALVFTRVPMLDGFIVYSSVDTLGVFAQHENQRLQYIEEYIKEEEGRLNQLKAFISRRKANNIAGTSKTDGMRGYQHPVGAHCMIRDWVSVMEEIKTTPVYNSKRLEEKLRSIKSPVPTKDDLTGSLRALIRLQQTYDIPVTDLTQGKIIGFQSSSSLTSSDFTSLGITAVDMGQMDLARTWFENSQKEQTPAQISQELTDRARMHNESDDPIRALRLLQMTSVLGNSHDISNETLEFEQPKNTTLEDDFEREVHCVERGNLPPIVTRSRYVFCELSNAFIPYAPFKAEILSHDPWIVVYYDVVSDSESQHLQDIARQNGMKRPVRNGEFVEDNISQTAWFHDKSRYPFIKELSVRIEMMIGLYTHDNMGEPMMVTNYGLGGHNRYHTDALERRQLATGPKSLNSKGNRLSSFILYLTDVIAGGGTAYPHAHFPLLLRPRKNAAVLWYNLHRNGTVDDRVEHSGCPVLLGDKWIAVKWTRSNGQMFRHPCGPTPTSTELECRKSDPPMYRNMSKRKRIVNARLHTK